jgi:hypothetical protein
MSKVRAKPEPALGAMAMISGSPIGDRLPAKQLRATGVAVGRGVRDGLGLGPGDGLAVARGKDE